MIKKIFIKPFLLIVALVTIISIVYFSNNTEINIKNLRKVVQAKEVKFKNKTNELEITASEKLLNLDNYCGNNTELSNVQKFIGFIRNKLSNNKTNNFDNLSKIFLRDISGPNEIQNKNTQSLNELELVFNQEDGKTEHLYISGFDLNKLPRAQAQDYDQGYCRLIKTTTPTIKQDNKSLDDSFFSFYSDKDGVNIDNNTILNKGSILFLDAQKDNILHLYLVSLENNTILAHYEIDKQSNVGIEWFINRFILKLPM